MIGSVLVVLLLVLGLPSGAAAEELTIAAASDLNYAMKELVEGFERQTGIHPKLSLGSSGNFYSQIINGAPFDLYFSADMRYPQKLEEAGLTVPGSSYPYAIGRIVLWVPSSSPVALDKGLAALLDASMKKVAIANPKHAPYGRAAVAALEHYQLYDRVRDRLVNGENIAQAAQFVESGACDAGIIALSLALSPTMQGGGRYWLIPESAHPPLEQAAVIVKQSRHQVEARRFLEFIKSPESAAVMRRYGFVLP